MSETLPRVERRSRIHIARADRPHGLDFQVPESLQAAEPPEARGLARDQVRLMVSHYQDNRILHAQFRDLPSFLRSGDVLVINTSGTLNAAVPVQRGDGTPLELHFSTRLEANLWLVELRRLDAATNAALPMFDGVAGEMLRLPGGAAATLLAPYIHGAELNGRRNEAAAPPARLWKADIRLPHPFVEYLDRYGFPIRYSYVPRAWPSSYYQTVYASEMGSAEMPSAGRAFTPELLTRLVARVVLIAPILLHTGVSSQEDYEPPYDEYYRVSEAVARTINMVRTAGGRVVAVGTTAVRAVETLVDEAGMVRAGEGWTKLVISPERGIRVFDALLTGFHEPRSSHLAMLEALGGREHVAQAYRAALDEEYLWHEFGDLHLLMP
jgi:S-adenosylmethionine:tRNA ribosyltransferase-isomerase